MRAQRDAWLHRRAGGRFQAGLLLIVCSLLAVGAPPLFAQDAVSLAGGRPAAAAVEQLRHLPVGKTLRMLEVPLGEGAPATDTLLLERFEVFSPDARIVIQSGSGIEERAPGKISFFRGRVEGDADSRVFWSVDAAGEMRGVTHRQGGIFVNRVPAGAADTPPGEAGSISRRVDPDADFKDRQFQCGADRLAPPASRLRALPAATAPAGSSEAAASGTAFNVNVAVDTDYEFYAKFGSSTTAERYVADLFGYVSTLYQNELNTRLSVSNVYLYTLGASSDPWSATSTGAALTEVGNYWQANRGGVARGIVHFMSGKPMGGGIAWMPGLCSTQYGYGVSGGIVGNFNPGNPQVVWDSMVVAHEIGHNFNSRHTHDFDGYNPPVGNGSPVDCCHADGDPPHGLCASVTKDLPGVSSLSGGAPGTGRGTLMSYCHLRSPGLSNVSMTFGLTHQYGIQAYRVPGVMRSQAEQLNGANPACVSVYTGASMIDFAATDYAVSEGDSVQVEIRRTGDTSGSANVTINVAGGTAGSSDYTLAPLAVTFSPSETSKTVTVSALADGVAEPNETLVLDLTIDGVPAVGRSTTVALRNTPDSFPSGGVLPGGWVRPAGMNGGWAAASDTASEGLYSLKSGALGNAQKAGIEISGRFRAGTVRFDYKVSSEQDYDTLRFYVDGVAVPGAQWSGEAGWASFSFSLSAGQHSLRWVYEKDVNQVGGQDAAWIDNVQLPGMSSRSNPWLMLLLD